ncbi:unnamed protein product, partial [Mesorhabditis belari]|uniref:G-protein coupled receptors family 1 profile domain-containing protein n=1 Tax=Mesorhabditis belari TaxID=2138241 RepID=A0AAF3FHJ1_9BILA
MMVHEESVSTEDELTQLARFFESVLVSATISSSWHLLALAVYQYFGIMWPLRTKIGVRRKHFRFLFIFLWITPMIILFAKYSIDPKDGLLAEKCVSHFRDRFSHRIFVAGLVLVPLIVTISLYIRIVCYLRGSYSMIKTKNWTQITENSVENFPKLVNTAVVIVISFIVGYGIHSIHSPLICKEGCPFRHGKTWIIWLGFLQSDLVILKFVANPFIYTLRMSCFRESISSMSQSFSTALTRMRGSSFQQMPKQESIRMGQL